MVSLKKNIMFLFLCLSLTILIFQVANASDEEFYVICGGDEEFMILCPPGGDEEFGVIGVQSADTSEGGGGGGTGSDDSPFCGNFICEPLAGENKTSCPEDCGELVTKTASVIKDKCSAPEEWVDIIFCWIHRWVVVPLTEYAWKPLINSKEYVHNMILGGP